MNIFVKTLAAAAEGTGVRRRAGRKRFERPHIHSDQVIGSDANKIGKRTIDA